MIQIICPNNNIPERTYAIEALFIDVLGCKKDDFVIRFKDTEENYELVVNNYKVIIEDHFFNHHTEPLSYLKQENIPNELHYFHGFDLEIPIIYGEDKFVKEDQKTMIGLDVFASTFFMLTRWEESLLGREEKGDCDEAQLFTVKQGIYLRPIVNEYATLLRKLIPSVLPDVAHKYTVILSHDVDGFLTPTWGTITKDLAKQTIHGKAKNKFLKLSWKDKVKYRRAFPTSYGQFELYTALTAKYGITEWFYFKVCGKREREATYLYDDNQTIDVVDRLKNIYGQKIILGFHPSQNVFNNSEQWGKETARIIRLLQCAPNIGRNHHLLYNYDSLRSWEGFGEDSFLISNCVFHKRIGFRSGVCVPYRLFDIYKQRVMNLIEYPCQIMDSAIRLHRYDSDESMWEDIHVVSKMVKRYEGVLVLTWHIYVRRLDVIMDYYKLCQEVLQQVCVL